VLLIELPRRSGVKIGDGKRGANSVLGDVNDLIVLAGECHGLDLVSVAQHKNENKISSLVNAKRDDPKNWL
jgi:hypothetical protein